MKKSSAIFSIPVLVAALGYFVDIYDLVLFGIYRVPSLKSIGLSGDELESVGRLLLNIQMIGMLIGGFFWGILGDKKGRLSVLFGSIIVYSIANLLNAFVTTPEEYMALRFFAGFGLAGELGAGITLVAEILKKEDRGWGTTLVATVGVSGAVVGGLLGTKVSWQTGYIIGGVLGLLLLFLRFGVFESGMYKTAKKEDAAMGSLSLLFANAQRLKRYLYCMLAGLPIWYGVGILVFFSPELGKELGIVGEIKPPLAVTWAYVGVTLGDLGSGLLSQFMKSRIKVIKIFIIATALAVACYPFLRGADVSWMYFVCFLIGTASGYWVVLITTSSEQFGTNIRATVTTTVPNFIRASLVPVSLIYGALFNEWLGYDKITSAMLTGVIVFAIALYSAFQLKETFGKDLNYYEH